MIQNIKCLRANKMFRRHVIVFNAYIREQEKLAVNDRLKTS